jgi:hypothetical protein
MDYDAAISWLKRRQKSEALLAIVLGVVCLVGSIVILAVTWSVIHAVCLYSFHWILGYGHWSYTLVPTVLLPLLFWGNARTSREYLSKYSVTTGTASDRVVVFYLPRVGLVSNVNPLAPDTVHTVAKIITDCLYVGPRVATTSIRFFAKAIRLAQMDVPACAAVITVLVRADHRMAFQEIVDSVEGLNPVTTFPQLHLVEGILFLESEPPGLALGTKLKAELAKVPYPSRMRS